MIVFKRNDYTKKEVADMPWPLSRLYHEFLQGFQSHQNILEECSIKYPEYFKTT